MYIRWNISQTCFLIFVSNKLLTFLQSSQNRKKFIAKTDRIDVAKFISETYSIPMAMKVCISNVFYLQTVPIFWIPGWLWVVRIQDNNGQIKFLFGSPCIWKQMKLLFLWTVVLKYCRNKAFYHSNVDEGN